MIRITVKKFILHKGYEYFGLENGDSCYCGYDDSNFLPAPSSECNYPCTGDSRETCGGSYRLSLYGTNFLSEDGQLDE